MREVDDRVGRLTLKELQRGGVVGPDGGVGYSEGYGGPMEDEEDESDSDLDEDKAVLPLQSERRPSSATKTKGKNVVSTQTTPLLPRAKRSGKRSLPPTTPLRGGRSHTLQTDTTPGGSNFSDLLRAAEMAIRPGTPAKNPGRASHIPISAMSATRSTTRAREEGNSDDGSSVKRARRDSPSTSWARGNENLSTETREERLEEEEMAQNSFPVAATIGSSSSQVQQDHPEAFALDLLAQASQLDAAQSASQDSGTQLERVARFSGALEEGERDDVNNSEGSASEYGLAPAIDLKSGSSSAPNPVEDHQIDPTLAGLPRPGDVAATPKIRPRTQSFASDVHTPARTYNQHIYPTPDMAFDETPGRGISPPYMGRDDILADELPLGAFASPTGATVPGLGKYVHLTSSMPARRVRSPYLKWTIEEVSFYLWIGDRTLR